jgi:hypothetical protein
MNASRSFTLSGLLMFVALAGCGPCESVITAVSRSPDGRFALLITRTNCGATDPFGTDIILMEALPSRELGEHKFVVFAVDERSPSFHVEATWKGPNSLLVICKGCSDSDIEIKHTSWKDVTIAYEIQP